MQEFQLRLVRGHEAEADGGAEETGAGVRHLATLPRRGWLRQRGVGRAAPSQRPAVAFQKVYLLLRDADGQARGEVFQLVRRQRS